MLPSVTQFLNYLSSNYFHLYLRVFNYTVHITDYTARVTSYMTFKSNTLGYKLDNSYLFIHDVKCTVTTLFNA
jgi:hypothetical protein